MSESLALYENLLNTMTSAINSALDSEGNDLISSRGEVVAALEDDPSLLYGISDLSKFAHLSDLFKLEFRCILDNPSEDMTEDDQQALSELYAQAIEVEKARRRKGPSVLPVMSENGIEEDESGDYSTTIDAEATRYSDADLMSALYSLLDNYENINTVRLRQVSELVNIVCAQIRLCTLYRPNNSASDEFWQSVSAILYDVARVKPAR